MQRNTSLLLFSCLPSLQIHPISTWRIILCMALRFSRLLCASRWLYTKTCMSSSRNLHTIPVFFPIWAFSTACKWCTVRRFVYSRGWRAYHWSYLAYPSTACPSLATYHRLACQCIILSWALTHGRARRESSRCSQCMPFHQFGGHPWGCRWARWDDSLDSPGIRFIMWGLRCWWRDQSRVIWSRGWLCWRG